MTDDAWRFTPTSEVLADGEDPRDPDIAARLLKMGFLVLYEGKSFRQFDEHWGERPRYLVQVAELADKPNWLRGAAHHRAAYRNIAGPGDENVSIWSMYPASVAAGETGRSEMAAWGRPTAHALSVVAFFNCVVPDWLLQLRVRSHVNKFMLDGTPVVAKLLGTTLLAHSALRLSCNHAGYAPLWREQVGDACARRANRH